MIKTNQDQRRKIFTLFVAFFILFSLVGFDNPPPSIGKFDDACNQFGDTDWDDADCASPPDSGHANDLGFGMSNFQVSPVSMFDPTDINLSRTKVPEGQPIDTIVGTFSTADPFLTATHTYSLVSGAGSSDNEFFNISGNQLRTSAEFNADIKNTYDIRVRSTNHLDLFVEKQFRITVTKTGDKLVGDEVFIYLPLITHHGSGFNSQFDGHAAGWVVHSGEWAVTGNYLFSFVLPQDRSSVSYNKSFTNFDYQVMMRRLGIDSNANQIFVRGTPTPLQDDNRWYNGYAFQYTRKGTYSIYKYMPNGDRVQLQGWTGNPAINKGDSWNLLRVVANGSHFSFYINGTLVWQGTDNSFSSGRVGIGMYRGAPTEDQDALAVDWAVLTTLGTSGAQGLGVPDPMLPDHQTIIDEMIIEGDHDQFFMP